jgi:hypothetical protein
VSLNNIFEMSGERRSTPQSERMLSPRLLHFGKDQVFWQCLSLSACETATEGLPSIVHEIPKMELHWRRAFHKGLLTGQKSLTGDERVELQLDDVWKMAVKSYTCTNLTYSKDRLMALSGIANVMAEALNERYIAGLWTASNGDLRSSRLPEQLGWKVLGSKKIDGTASQRFEKYCAPTWSWASVDGVIEIKDRSDQGRVYQASIENVDIKLERENIVTGRVLAGSSIDVRGLVFTLQLERSPRERGHYVWQPNSGVQTAWCHAWLDDHAQSAPNETNLCATILMLAYTTNIPPMLPAGTSGHGILIKAVPHAPGSFTRIGVLEFRSLSSSDWSDLSRNQHMNPDDSSADLAGQLFHQEVVTLI